MRRSASTLVAPGWQLNISRRPQVALEEAAGSCVAEKSWTDMPSSVRAYLAHVYFIAIWLGDGLTPLLRLSLRQDHPSLDYPALFSDTLVRSYGLKLVLTRGLSKR